MLMRPIKSLRRGRLVSAAGFCAFAMTALMAVVPPAHGEKLPKVKLGIPSGSMSATPVFVAQERNYFKDAGLNVKVRMIPEVGDMGVGSMNALIAGSVQFAHTGGAALVRASLQGQKLIGLASSMNRIGMEIVASRRKMQAANLLRSAPLKDRLAFLRGKTIGFPRLGDMAHMYALYVMAKAGLTPQRDVTLVTVGKGMAMVLALQLEKIDAFVFPPPFSVIPEVQGFGWRLISGPENDISDLVPFVSTVLTARKEYFEEHRDLARGMVKAHARSGRFINENPEATLEILKKHYQNMNPEILERSFEVYSKTFAADPRIDARGLEIVQDLQLQTGVIKEKLDVSALFTNELFE